MTRFAPTRNASRTPRSLALGLAAVVAAMISLPAAAQPKCTPSGWLDFHGDLTASYVGKCPSAPTVRGETFSGDASREVQREATRDSVRSTPPRDARPQAEREPAAKTSSRAFNPPRVSHDGFMDLGGDSSPVYVGLPTPEAPTRMADGGQQDGHKATQ